MSEIISLLFWPLVVGLLLLLIEYFIIQPIRKRIEPSPPRGVSSTWQTAMRKAIRSFKENQIGSWNLWTKKKVTIEGWSIQRGYAILVLAVWNEIHTAEQPIPAVAQFVKKSVIVAKYELTIDRTGEILRMTSFR